MNSLVLTNSYIFVQGVVSSQGVLHGNKKNFIHQIYLPQSPLIVFGKCSVPSIVFLSINVH